MAITSTLTFDCPDCKRRDKDCPRCKGTGKVTIPFNPPKGKRKPVIKQEDEKVLEDWMRGFGSKG